MRYRKLGRTNFQVSEIGYGLWGMGGWSGSDDQQSRASLELAAELGCNFFDSAQAYGDGKSDQLLGELLASFSPKNMSHPDRSRSQSDAAEGPAVPLVAASKIPPKDLQWPPSSHAKYHDVFPQNHVFHHVDSIRKNLQQDTIDLLQFHVWEDRWIDEPEFRNTVETLKSKGLITAFGLSLNRWQPANGIRAIETGLIDTVQVIYNIFDQNPEDELFPACKQHNIGVISRVPLDEGSLGGKMTRETRFNPDDWRAKYFNPSNLTQTMDRIDALKKILPEGMTLPEMAIRFILANPVVSTIIIGMRNPDHVRSNLSYSSNLPLSDELLAKLKQHRWNRSPAPWSD